MREAFLREFFGDHMSGQLIVFLITKRIFLVVSSVVNGLHDDLVRRSCRKAREGGWLGQHPQCLRTAILTIFDYQALFPACT
jgi:hypothetical protein